MTIMARLDREWYKPTGDGFDSELDKIHLAKYRWMDPFCESSKVLDAGCGAGYGSFAITRSAVEVVGVDKDSEAIAWAQTMYQDAKLRYELGEYQDVEEHFDIAIGFGLAGMTRDLDDMRNIILDLAKLADIVVVDCPAFGTRIPLHYNELTVDEWESVIAIWPGQVERFRQAADRFGQAWDAKSDYYIAVLSAGTSEHWQDFGFTEKREPRPLEHKTVAQIVAELRAKDVSG